MKTGFLGLWGAKVDAIDHHVSEIEKLSKEVPIFIFLSKLHNDSKTLSHLVVF